MNKKALILSCLLVGLMTVTFAVPAAADCSKPSFALDEGDVEGWALVNESCLEISYPPYTFSMWWQVWADNDTWIHVTKAIAIVAMDFGVNLNDEIMGVSLWDTLADAFAGIYDTTDVPGTGLDHCILWNETGIWFAIGNKGSVLVMAFGWNSELGPGDIFSSMAVPKVDSTDATDTDLITLMTAQGGEFGGIPGFTLFPIIASVALVLGLIFFIRKDQLSLLKTA